MFSKGKQFSFKKKKKAKQTTKQTKINLSVQSSVNIVGDSNLSRTMVDGFDSGHWKQVQSFYKASGAAAQTKKRGKFKRGGSEANWCSMSAFNKEAR